METISLPDRDLHLGPDDIHIWFANLNVNCARLPTLESYLGADERVRADRYHFHLDRDHFVCAHGILRELLGAYSGQHPANLRFTYGPFGKPAAIQSGNVVPKFNCSRSGDIALFAFALDRDVGVDIECIEEDDDFLNIAMQYYTLAENEILKNLDGQARMVELFRYWTRREAYLKATGDALGHPTVELDVSDSVIRSEDGASTWTIETFDFVPGYASSLASAGMNQIHSIFDYGALPASIVALRTAS